MDNKIDIIIAKIEEELKYYHKRSGELYKLLIIYKSDNFISNTIKEMITTIDGKINAFSCILKFIQNDLDD